MSKENEQVLREAAEAALLTLRHARVFIGSRQKMHPDGQALYDEDVSRLAAALALPEHQPVEGVEPDWTIERDARGEAMVCAGCGTTRTISHIRYISPTAFSCCPERKMIPVREALRLAALSASPAANPGDRP